MSVYLDCNATTPIEPEVLQATLHYMSVEFGNAGSRTHEFGTAAKKAVERAREQVAKVVQAKSDEVIFTSGATEANNLAILGLTSYGERTGRRHVVSTAIEHKAVLEPVAELRRRGFAVTTVPPNREGSVSAEAIREALRQDTLLVSVMHVNNETGVIQPISDIARALQGHEAYFHTDAAQGFGKELEALKDPRVDFISLSGHKIFAPKGIGALVARRRDFERPPLAPIMFGGGQERGLRPGTLPVHLIVAIGLAAEIAVRDHRKRLECCLSIRKALLDALAPLRPNVHGPVDNTVPHVLNFSLKGVDSEAVMVALKGLAALSNGSACTSHSYEPSHVLVAMGLSAENVAGAVRASWCHLTPDADWNAIREVLASFGELT